MVDVNLLADKLSYYIPGYPSIISLSNPILPLAFDITALLSKHFYRKQWVQYMVNCLD